MNTYANLPRRSTWLLRLFRWYAKRYVVRHFHAVRVSHRGPIPDLPRRPVVIVVNHPSWWDPLIGLTLTERMPDWRVHFAPIEAAGLAQYRFLERLGFFGIDTATARGGLTFLRTSLAILSAPESMLWITAQGEFVDPRDRPVLLKPGIGHLAHRLSGALIVPLALEYPFWNDRCPEALARFGSPIDIDSARLDRRPSGPQPSRRPCNKRKTIWRTRPAAAIPNSLKPSWGGQPASVEFTICGGGRGHSSGPDRFMPSTPADLEFPPQRSQRKHREERIRNRDA